jgi:NAD-dependent dihydropyrimidine dehydrogenase PreA subunit
MLVGRLTLPFEKYRHGAFIARLEKSKNTKALAFISPHDATTVGVMCGSCKETKPFYRYGQNPSQKYGIHFTKCTKCLSCARCPYSEMLSDMKGRSNDRGHSPPEYTVDDLKEMYITQHGRCAISGAPMKEKRNDNDPYNMSPERLDNKKGYVVGNVVLICQFLQIGGTHDYLPDEIRSWFNYDGIDDGFVFDTIDFTKPNRKKKRDTITPIKTYNDNGVLISKTCTDCMVDKKMSCFSNMRGNEGEFSFCKPCATIRKTQCINTSPYNFIMKMSNNATSSTKKRDKKRSRNDDSGTSDANIFNLFVSIIKKQKGRCSITNIPFVYKTSHKFAPSPDRIDNGKGYIAGNVEMIIAPLNTRYKPPNTELRELVMNDINISVIKK